MFPEASDLVETVDQLEHSEAFQTLNAMRVEIDRVEANLRKRWQGREP